MASSGHLCCLYQSFKFLLIEAWQRILVLLQLGVAEHERQCRDPVEICWVLLWLLGFSTTIA